MKIQATTLKDECLKVFVTLKMQETSQVVIEIHQTLSSAYFGVCLLIGLACYEGGQLLCGSYLLAVRSSGVAAPAVAALHFVFPPALPTLLRFFEWLAQLGPATGCCNLWV